MGVSMGSFSAVLCQHCIFWGEHSECRRRAPGPVLAGQLELGGNSLYEAVWPETRPDDWCGDAVPRSDGEKEG